jgi:hydroxymethylbilane synthase
MCQAQIVHAMLEERAPGQTIRLQAIKAQADKSPEAPLATIVGEGVFVKELETALLEQRIDLAVHSMKDVPLDVPEGLCIAAVLAREDPRDALVARAGDTFDTLPRRSRIGTSSLRRRSQLLHRRQDLEFCDIRGNVDTRLRKLDEGHYDAVVLAACGLIRLGLEERITEYLDVGWMLPEPGQGALAVEARADDEETLELLRALDDPVSRACVEAERAFLRALGGGCRVPIAAYASIEHGDLHLDGAVIASDGHDKVCGTLTGSMMEPRVVGERLAASLTSQGARQLLKGNKEVTR